MTTAEQVENLLGIPSFHWEPVFAREVRAAMKDFAPTVIAIEAPPETRDEFIWAADCWPTPVCTAMGGLVYPFVPGDSILEAFRLARDAAIPVHFVDLLVRRRLAKCRPLPDPSLAARLGAQFRETVEAIEALTPHQKADLAREAAMARSLRLLMDSNERVMWVGGMAHWRRMVTRLAKGDYRARSVSVLEWRAPERLRLSGGALHRLTGRYPWVVSRYAEDPDGYQETDAIQALTLTAMEETPENIDKILVVGNEQSAVEWAEEPASPNDVAKVVTYARHLAATARVGDRPTLPELVTAAAATIGRRYAGRLLAAAMQEQAPTPAAAELPILEVRGTGPRCFRVGKRRLVLVPGWGRGLPGKHRWSIRAVKQSIDDPFDHLPGQKAGERCKWVCYPPDEQAYEAFVTYVLRRASMVDPAEVNTVPFDAGLLDGIDVRETLRHWYEGKIVVRDECGPRLHITNGIIDWEHASEHDERLQGIVREGWIDPDLMHVGSASRPGPYNEVRARPRVQIVRRDFSLVSLDCPTWALRRGQRDFYDSVISKLLLLRSDDNLYGWLRVFFEYCSGKPVVYYSRYVPSPRIHRIAWDHRVTVIHIPLSRIPAPLLRRARTFLFACLTEAQWREVVKRVADQRGGWLG